MSQPPGNPPRVLIVDGDPEVRRHLQELLADAYDVQAIEADGYRLVRAAKRRSKAFRPHVVVVDPQLEDLRSEDWLSLLRRLNSAKCILYSGIIAADFWRQAQQKHGDLELLQKGEPAQRLLAMIQQCAHVYSAGHRRSRPNWPSDFAPEKVAAIVRPTAPPPARDVDDLLLQLFPDDSRLELRALGNNPGSLAPISRGRSAVFEVRAGVLEPDVIKFVPPRDAAREKRNHDRYVHRRLRGRFKAQLRAVKVFWELGGLVYTFLGSENPPLTFAEFYARQADPGVILGPLEHFFGEVWRGLYTHARADPAPTLFAAYDRILKLSARLRAAGLCNPAGAMPHSCNPAAWAIAHAGESDLPCRRQAITHGDLHAENLLVDGEHAWTIDFERSGPGPILRDFAELEVDIATRLVPALGEADVLYAEFVRCVVHPAAPGDRPRPSRWLQQQPDAGKALEVIGGLRALACEVTGLQNLREHYWGLLCDALFVAILVAKDSLQQRRALILAEELAERLEALG